MKYGLDDIERFLKNSKHDYSSNDWFFPADLVPHSSAFKYACKKLFEQGKLDKVGSPGDRWGYTYRIKIQQ